MEQPCKLGLLLCIQDVIGLATQQDKKQDISNRRIMRLLIVMHSQMTRFQISLQKHQYENFEFEMIRKCLSMIFTILFVCIACRNVCAKVELC